MDIKRLFNTITGRASQPAQVHTAHGTLNLAQAEAQKRVKKIAIALQQVTDRLTRKDIADWRAAWQMAISVDNPNRNRLYDIYRDCDVDGHLSGCIRQRQSFVMAKSFKLVSDDGEEHEEVLSFFDQAWFKQLCIYILDSRNWGHSLIELGEVIKGADGNVCYSDVTLLPRKHVIPEYGRIVQNVGDDWHSGIDYRATPFCEWLIEAGRPTDLGLLLKAAQHTIPKKNMLAFWDAFGEIFGMPMRVAKTATRDDTEINKIHKMLADMGAAQTAVLPIDTELQFIESTRADAFKVYDERIGRANSELSKLIIGQTMTIEDGSSLSQSQTHLQVFQNLIEDDADMLRDVINNQLLPRMVRHGFPVAGLRFEWDYSVDYTPEQQVAYETMIADRYEVDPAYFAQKYSMPVGERRNPMALPAVTDDDPKEDDPKGGKPKDKQNHARPFFD